MKKSIDNFAQSLNTYEMSAIQGGRDNTLERAWKWLKKALDPTTEESGDDN